ncbi:tetratricopeptide repeat protein, partial [bacterium]|nr:tetratricopeptide repeat protein [bacterium]
VTLRNLVESGEPVLVSANGGINFYVGNGPGADGFSSVPPGLAWRRLSGDSELAGAGGLADGPYWYARGLDAVLQSPGRAVGLFFKKALGFFNAADVSNNVDIGWARGQSLWLRLNPLRWWLVAPFGLAGLFTALGRNRKRLLRDENPGSKRGLTILTAFALTYYAGVIAFFVTSRYRMPMVPVLALLGAGFVAYLGKIITAKTKRLNFLPWVVLLVCLVLTLIPVVPVEDGFYGHFYAGLALENRGLLSEALVEYNRALEIRPDDPEAHQRRGAVRGHQGDQRGRREDLERAVELSPDYADALYDLAVLIQGTGSPDGSLPLFERALEVEPDFVPARMAYGMALQAKGDITEAAAQFESAVELRPRFSAAHRLLGETYSALGRAREAAEEFFLADYFGGEIWE